VSKGQICPVPGDTKLKSRDLNSIRLRSGWRTARPSGSPEEILGIYEARWATAVSQLVVCTKIGTNIVVTAHNKCSRFSRAFCILHYVEDCLAPSSIPISTFFVGYFLIPSEMYFSTLPDCPRSISLYKYSLILS